MSFSVSDAHNFSRTGAWGAVTSTLDFCEANYQFSDYIAEMANTLSNLVTIALAVHGARMSREQKLPDRYYFGFLTLALIGIGSFAFHATLLHTAQLSDELPMIYTVSHSLYILFDTCPGYKITANKKSMILLIAVVLSNALFSYSYWLYRNPIYHQVVFAALMVTNTARGTWLLRSSKASSKLGPIEKKTTSHLFTYGAWIFLLGFAIWNVDNVFCDALSRLKASIGWPGAFLLEGHSWWHLLTVTGAYYMGIGTTYVSLCIKDDPRKYTVIYERGWLPAVRRVSKVKG